MSTVQRPTILVIVGITGDLAQRKLLPAVEAIAKAGALPDEFRIIGISRRDVSAEEVLASQPARTFLDRHLEMFTMDLAQAAEYDRLKDYLTNVSGQLGGNAQQLFYLSIPPQVSEPVVHMLGHAGLADKTVSKLLLEKPFGTDLTSARELVRRTTEYFDESQLYRIDHYLAKEMTQNIIIFRGANVLFRDTWNKRFIESIDIIAAEQIGIEGRVHFYDQTGALRDIVQSHLLQLAALVLMRPADPARLDQVPKLRLEALRQLRMTDPPRAYRAQYQGYQEEVNNPGSSTETFVGLELVSNDPEWEGVPIRLVTGKALADKVTEIKVNYRQADGEGANQLTLRIQPQEGVDFCIWTKRPGYERQVEKLPLKFTYQDHYDQLPEAYEQVLLDAISSEHQLFASSDEVIESWRILEPLIRAWKYDSRPLPTYPKGSYHGDVLKNSTRIPD